MGRASNIPGVYVDSIKAESPPYDKPNVVQEFVGEGITRDFLLEPASRVGGDKVSDFIDSAQKTLGSPIDRLAIKYNLLVRARSKRGARAKARAYIRIVNPFSPGVIHVEKVKVTEEHSDIAQELGPLNEFYDIRVFVAK